MMWAEIRDNHVFVWWNGVLIYKRWATPDGGFEGGRGMVFEDAGMPWMAGHTEYGWRDKRRTVHE